MPPRTLKPSDPMFVGALKKYQIAAVKAVYEGVADESQQRMALMIVIDNLCRVNDLSYRPGSQDGTTFAEGRRYVGLQIHKLITTNIGDLPDDED